MMRERIRISAPLVRVRDYYVLTTDLNVYVIEAGRTETEFQIRRAGFLP